MKSQCLKYSGAKLHEKGILVSIQDLPTHQYKNVLFEIRPTESNGVFSVCGKFMGVEMETIEINIQVYKTISSQQDSLSIKSIRNSKGCSCTEKHCA